MHVDVLATVLQQQDEAGQVGQQRQDGYAGHGGSQRLEAMRHFIGDTRKHAETERDLNHSFHHGGSTPPAEASLQKVKAHCVRQRVTEVVGGVRDKRRGVREHTSEKLDAEARSFRTATYSSPSALCTSDIAIWGIPQCASVCIPSTRLG